MLIWQERIDRIMIDYYLLRMGGFTEVSRLYPIFKLVTHALTSNDVTPSIESASASSNAAACVLILPYICFSQVSDAKFENSTGSVLNSSYSSLEILKNGKITCLMSSSLICANTL